MEALWLKPLSFWALFFLPLMAQVYKNNTLRKEKIKLEFFIVIVPTNFIAAHTMTLPSVVLT